LLGLVAQGSSGVVFRAERAGQPEAGIVALKLARQPGDPRFALEGELLSRVRHPGVPRLHDSGEWTGPGGALFPFLVMDWVDGLPLYAWARLQSFSARQGMRVLAQLARAVQAVHAASGIHRDIKGDNVLVRASDGQVVLTDFGSCTWRGAPVLTRQSYPPSTEHYWSPQAQLHQWKFRRRAAARYEAIPEDDLYALGVTAYRLVTGRYPLIASDEEMDGDDAFSRFPELVPAENLVELPPELARWIRQMLAVEPKARGTAAELALGLELAAKSAGREADRPIVPRVAPARSAPEAPAPEERAAPPAPVRPPLAGRKWLTAAAVSMAMATSVWNVWQALSRAPAMTANTASQTAAQTGETAGLGELAFTEPLSAPEPLAADKAIGEEVPTEPLPDQRLPPCKKPLIKINGGCWVLVGDQSPPCPGESYEWQKRCYLPVAAKPPRPATSGNKEKPPHGLSNP
jgi:hypothetical protein